MPIASYSTEGFKVQRFFESSSDYMKVLVETDKTRNVKCAVYDKEGNPLRVDEQTVTPPLDEVLIRTGDATPLVDSVKCFVME